MLFDLEDYRIGGIIGPDNKPVNQINWVYPYTTFRATRDAYLKAVNEYLLSAQVMCTPEEAQALNVKMLEFLDSNLVLGPLSRQFWNAMVSLPLAGQLNVGDRFDVFDVNKNAQDSSYIAFPNYSFQTYWTQNNKSVAVLNSENGEYVYTEMTQQLYDDYKAAYVVFQSKVKDIIIISEGGVENFNDYVAPAVPAWNSYPELSGYVRGTNNLTIKDAVVRLIDDAGENHDIVTDDNGYFKFSKEMFYNNITFNHTATASNFNMFVLEHKSGSTASLYDPTNIYQNSFFGAENDREMTWSVQIRMGKPARRNFKIDFITDYSNYPSFSGYIKDAAGNPIKDAFVMIKDSNTGYCIGQYKKPNGDIAMNYKYNDFGVDRTILTDENGFYEYTSQMVGEWFNKEFMQVGEVAGNLGGRVFDDYFGSREDLICLYDSYRGIELQYKESFFPVLIPYKQDANSNSIVWEGTPLYDNNDYYASRFKYALTSYGEFQYQRIDLDTHYDIDVDVTVATNDEFRADKFTVELLTERKNLESGLSSQTYVNTTSGYFKVVYPTTGESYVANAGNYYYTYNHLDINYSNADDYKDFYVYSCDSQGRAMGYIKEINTPSFTKTVDLLGLKYLRVFNPANFYGESIDFSGLKYLQEISLNYSSSLKNIIGLESKKMYNLSLYKLSVLENIDISGLTGLTDVSFEYLPALQSLDFQSNTNLRWISLQYVDVEFNVAGLTMLSNIYFNKLTMTSDDVDDLLIQLASMVPNQDGNNISNGNINIQRITRSSYSDDAYATLMERSWNINLGSYFYDEEIVPDKLIIEVDPSFASSNEWMDMNAPSISTTTGYWIGKLWTGQFIGNVGFTSVNISNEFRLGTTDARIEIFSCNEFGVPAGEITSFAMNTPKIKNVDTSELSALVNFEIYYDGSGPYSSIESLDFTSNTNLVGLIISASKVESINLTGLTSLKNIVFDRCRDLNQIIGFSTLSSLEDINLSNTSSLEYLSLAGFENMKSVYIYEVDLYDSTHVDTMLAELNANNAAKISSLDAAIIVKQAALDAKQAELDVQNADHTILTGELNQLIADGADQSLIDAKQAEIDASDNLNAYIYSQYVIISDAKAAMETDREFYSVGNKFFNTTYMARTSASDADYESLLTYHWNLNIGADFVAPYTAPVKGFVTYNWTPDQNGDTLDLSSALQFSSSTGYVKYVSGRYSGILPVGTNELTYPSYTVTKGVTEFWSCDSHGRPGGSIIGFGHAQNSTFLKSFDISNLTEIKNFNLNFIRLSSIDLSSNINIEKIMIGECQQLESIVGFEDLVNLKDLYIYDSKKLDIPVDFTSMLDLQRIYLWGLGINKNSRLNVSGLTKLQILCGSWINMLSVDLDNALLALDAAGLNSESDFNYEGHLDFGAELRLLFGMGINYHPEFASAFTSLQSKQWSLDFGNQIIDSIEEPTKGIVRWGVDTGWAALGFSLSGEFISSIMANYPDGTTRNIGTMISYTFDSSVPVEDRFVEFWGVDNYERPVSDFTMSIYDSWSTGITSLEVSNMNTIINSIDIPNSKIESLNLSGFDILTQIYLQGSTYLESVILDGCVRLNSINMNGCTNLDIDQILQSLDNNDYLNLDTKYLDAYPSVATSFDSIDSLVDKNWSLNIIEPASSPVIFNVVGGNIGFEIGTSTGCVKVVFPTGSEMYQNYPDGWIQSHGKYYSSNNFGSSYYSFDANNFTGQISIISVAYNPNDGSYINSGKVRYVRNNYNGDFNYSTVVDSLKVLSLYQPTSTDIANLSNLNLSKVIMDSLDFSNSLLDLSNLSSKELNINSSSINEILFNNSSLEKLYIDNVSQLNSIDLTGAVMTDLWISNTNVVNLELPADLQSYGHTNTNISGNLDFSGLESLRNIYINNSDLRIPSIDISNLSNLIDVTLSNFNGDIIGLETTSVTSFNHNEVSKDNYELVLPISMTNFTLSSKSMQSVNITAATGSFSDPNLAPNLSFSIYDYSEYYGGDSITSMVIPTTAKYYTFSNLSFMPDLSSIEDTTASVNINQPRVSVIDFQNIELQSLRIADRYSGSDQFVTSVTISGSVSQLTIDSMGWYGFSGNWDGSNVTNQGRGVSIDLSNLYHKDVNSSINLYLINLNNFTLLNTPKTAVYFSGTTRNINLSGKTFSSVNITHCSVVNDINLSGATVTGNVYINWCLRVTSMNFDGLSCNELAINYCTRGNDINAYGTNAFAISMISAVIWHLIINTVRKVSTINATDASIRHIGIHYSQDLSGLTLSLKGTEAFNFTMSGSISSITLTDAGISTLLNYIGIEGGSNLSASIVDSVINAVSATNRTGKTMKLRNMNARTSASQTAYNKLIGQSWNMLNV